MRRARVPSVAACLFAIAGWHLRCRVAGLRRSVRAALRAGAHARCAEGERAVLVEETARRVALAAAFYPARALCLEQSLALSVLLRRRGVAAELRIGAQALPFRAHAWVEVAGQAINERADVARTYATFRLAGV
jgi:hypothetical protein